MAAVILELKEARPVCLLYVWSSLKNKAIWAKEASFYHKKHHLSDFVPDVNIFIYLNIFYFLFFFVNMVSVSSAPTFGIKVLFKNNTDFKDS